jgi:hypothetical protein
MNKKMLDFTNGATIQITSILGVTLALSSFLHGFFEILQGNKATSGMIIQAIGEHQRFWVHGTEEAFTVIPNFMITGLIAIILSIATATWSIKFIGNKHGSAIFLILCIALTMFGGGIAHVAFFLPVWAYSTRSHKRLTLWRKVFSNRIGVAVGKLWRVSVAVALAAFIMALVISVFGFVPGVEDPDTKLYICWSILGVSFILIHISYISGFASDVQKGRI